ncbi:MAG: hypothetical protein K0R59_215 [Sphingobacterium sp.]|jgi:hypothetical protein|nr:hypothetical protein [Sphingobacterium sp.]
MKKKVLCFVIGLASFGMKTVSAQFSRPVSVGLGMGLTYSRTDLRNNGTNFAFYGELDYVISPFVSFGLHAEKGRLNGDADDSHFKNNYYVGNLNAKIRLGKFMRLPDNYSYYSLQTSSLSLALSNIYVGVGAGLMKNRINRQLSPGYIEALTAGGDELLRDPSGIYIIIPLNAGIDIPFGRTLYGPKWAINLNYQHTLTVDDNLDGISTGKNDHYGYISLGVKYALFQRQ